MGQLVEEVATNKCLPPDHYALYLVIGDGDSYRVLSSSDRLLGALSSVGSECHLCLKTNAFHENIKPFVSVRERETEGKGRREGERERERGREGGRERGKDREREREIFSLLRCTWVAGRACRCT